LGAPVFLAVDKPVASGLWVAQDTGGAIKGANRFDTFWGAGAEAKRIAGGMQANGDAYVLLPKGTVSRLNSDYAASRSEEHTSELQSLMRISYAVFCLKK